MASTTNGRGRDGGDRATPGTTSSDSQFSATPAVLLTDATVDRFHDLGATGRESVTIGEIVKTMGADPNDADLRAVVWMRVHGVALLPGLLGHVQRANAKRLMEGHGPLSWAEIEGIIRAHAPGASMALVHDVLRRFAEHLACEILTVHQARKRRDACGGARP